MAIAYLLASAVSAPLRGKIGDLGGCRPVFQFAIAVFPVGSVLPGLVAANARSGRAEVREPKCSLSPDDRRVADKLVAARHEGLAETLDGWSSEQHEEVARLLGRLANELLREEPEPVLAASLRAGGR